MPSQPAVHRLHIFADGPVAGNAAQRALPGMDMRVDQAGQDDHAAGVDDFGIVGGERRRDRRDAAVLYQHVAARQILDHRVHRDDRAALDQ